MDSGPTAVLQTFSSPPSHPSQNPLVHKPRSPQCVGSQSCSRAFSSPAATLATTPNTEAWHALGPYSRLLCAAATRIHSAGTWYYANKVDPLSPIQIGASGERSREGDETTRSTMLCASMVESLAAMMDAMEDGSRWMTSTRTLHSVLDTDRTRYNIVYGEGAGGWQTAFSSIDLEVEAAVSTRIDGLIDSSVDSRHSLAWHQVKLTVPLSRNPGSRSLKAQQASAWPDDAGGRLCGQRK